FDAPGRELDDLLGVAGQPLLAEAGHEDPTLASMAIAVLGQDVHLQGRGRAVAGHPHHHLDEVGEQSGITEHAMVELRAERTQPARCVSRQSHEIGGLIVELEHPRDRIGQEAEHVELVAVDRQRTRTWKRDLREIEEHRHGNGRYETYPPRSDKMDDITIKATAS